MQYRSQTQLSPLDPDSVPERSAGFSLLVPPRETVLGPVASLLLYIVLLAIPYVLLNLGAWFSPPAPDTHAGSAILLLNLSSAAGEWYSFAYVVFATWFISRVEGLRLLDYGLRGPHRFRRAAAGAFWGVLGLSLLAALIAFSHHLVLGGPALHRQAAWGYALAWAFMFVGVGFFEELLFRGYLQVALARCFAALYTAAHKQGRHPDTFGFWAAAAVISFGFGFGHRSNPGESPLGLLAAGLAGLLFAYSLWRTGSLWWAIGFHTAWDWAQSFLFGVPDSGTLIREHLLSARAVGAPWLSGGVTGPEGSVFVFPVLLFIVVIIATTLPPTRALVEAAGIKLALSQKVHSATA